jgi:hypothetical protein
MNNGGRNRIGQRKGSERRGLEWREPLPSSFSGKEWRWQECLVVCRESVGVGAES